MVPGSAIMRLRCLMGDALASTWAVLIGHVLPLSFLIGSDPDARVKGAACIDLLASAEWICSRRHSCGQKLVCRRFKYA
jgi:hypothetical protein